LNLAVPEDAKALIKPWEDRESTDRYADSGVDDQVCVWRPLCLWLSVSSGGVQMIIHIPFTENVRLRSILLKLGGVFVY
jgi:hypothetical protein